MGVTMRRRSFLLAASSAGIFSSDALAQVDSFAAKLNALANDLSALDDAKAFNERYQRLPGEPLGAQNASWKAKSLRKISQRAWDLIVRSEVSSAQTYTTKYQHAVLPGVASGLTIGIGYDLGQVSAETFTADWSGLLSSADIETLSKACGLKAASAATKLKDVRNVTVQWDIAAQQFNAFLPFAIGETERTFPNCADLSADSLGALVSLVYNRGSSLSPTSDRRREMRQIFTLMRDRQFSSVAPTILRMQRLWVNDPKARGVVARRELESILFAQGLNGTNRTSDK
jgi:hypothetical protein